MKRFKELRENLIVESEFSPYGLANRSIHSDHGVHRLDTDNNIAKINSFIETFLSGNTLHPKVKLEQLRVRLNHIGLDFDTKNATMDEDVTSIPVTYYGKVFGYELDNQGSATGVIGDQDLATQKFGKPLVFSVKKVNEGEGVCQLEGSIHYANEDDGLEENALELRLHIDNDEDLFESKIRPALENAQDEDEALRGLLFAVKSAVKGYEMEVTEDEIRAVAESILMDSIEEDDDNE